MRDVFEQMYGNDMLAGSTVLVLIGSAIVVDFIGGFTLVTVIGTTTVTRVPFVFAVVVLDATVVTLTGATVVVGAMVVVVGGS